MSKYATESMELAVAIFESFGFVASEKTSGNKYASMKLKLIENATYNDGVRAQLSGYGEYVSVNLSGLGISKGRNISYSLNELAAKSYKNKLVSRVKRATQNAEQSANRIKRNKEQAQSAYDNVRGDVQAELDKAGVIDYTIKKCEYGSSAIVTVNGVEVSVDHWSDELQSRIKVGDFQGYVPFLKAVLMAQMVNA